MIIAAFAAALLAVPSTSAQHRFAPITVTRSIRHAVFVQAQPRYRLHDTDRYIGSTGSIPNLCACPASAISFDKLDGTFYFTENQSIAKGTTAGTETAVATISSWIGGIAFDPKNQKLYASDTEGCAIDAIDKNDNLTVLAGGTCGTTDGQGTAAQFQDPTGMIVDGTNDLLYVADGNTVRSITTAGLVTTVAQTGVTGFSRSGSSNEGLAVDPSTGTLFLSNPYQNVILSISSGGVVSWIAGRPIPGNYQEDGPPGSALFDDTTGIVFSPIDHHLYLADQSNNQIRRIGAGDVTLTIAGDGRLGYTDGVGIGAEFYTPTGITIDPSTGLLYVAEWGYDGNIRTVTTEGSIPPPPPHGIAMLDPASVPNGASGAAIAADGTFWFAENAANKIGHVLANGSIVEIPLPGGLAHPTDMVLGGDGNVWFDDGLVSQYGEPSNSYLAKIRPNGTITEYSMDTQGSEYSASAGLTLGPDGNVWFIDPNSSAIGYITPSGKILEEVVNPPNGIATGPDGDLWTTVGSKEIDQNATDGTILHRYFVSDAPIGLSIVRGSDNRMWFTANNGFELGALDATDGTVTYYGVPKVPNCLPACSRGPADLASGPNAVWFVVGDSTYPFAISEMTPAGVYTEYPVTTPHSHPSQITFAANGSTWFTDFGANKVGYTY
jgi:streptogramin lyase